MNKEITIIADTNDGDYVTNISKISEANLVKIMPLIKAIKKSRAEYGHNYNTCYEDFDDDTINEAVDCVKKQYPKISAKTHDLFSDHCPNPEHGVHTIISISISDIPKRKLLLGVLPC